MELNEELDGLLDKAESLIRNSVRKHGGFDIFALILKNDGSLQLLEGPDEPLQEFGEIGYFLDELLPLARRGEIKASAICTYMSADGDGGFKKLAIIDLEHQNLLHALVTLPYENRGFRGWFFGTRQLRQESPALFAPSQKAALCKVAHQEFLLKLDEDWTRIASDDPERFLFYSEEKKTSIVISVMMTGPIPLDRLLGVANHLADSRLGLEKESDPTRQVTIGSCNVELKENGQVGLVTYIAYADDGHIIRFIGWVTQRKIFSLWVSSETSDSEYSRNVFNEVFGGLRLYIP